jgi:UDP-N-acetylglucosamine 2-epimerase (non-hydrolysing)
MKTLLVFGTRPEIIKLAPVIHELKKRGQDFLIVHTGQHFSENMDLIFWKNLNLPEANYHLAVREPTHARQTAEMLKKLDEIFEKEKPNWVVVHGDTNSTVSGALAAVKHPGIRIAHVEAGLRSFDRTMPEEINRIIVDHISHLLFAPTANAVQLLTKEGIPADKIVLTGNTIEDILNRQIQTAEKSSQILTTLSVQKDHYILLTVHRQENTDSNPRLKEILDTVFTCAKEKQLKIVFPIHPRTKKNLDAMDYKMPSHVIVTEPLGYDDFLVLEKNACALVTDSGGLQEEGCILHIPCITLRENTERPETIEIGANILAGVKADGIRQAFAQALQSKRSWLSPYGGGSAAMKIVDRLLL